MRPVKGEANAGEVTPVTQALILAAGRGSRLGRHTSKPLFPLLGVPLLARTLFTLQQAGITDAWVVLGYEGDRVRREIETIRRLSIRVHWVENPRWEEPNGVSVLAAEEHLSGPFILTMSDHLFQPGAVERLRAGASESPGLDLVVDYHTEDILDPDKLDFQIGILAGRAERSHNRVGRRRVTAHGVDSNRHHRASSFPFSRSSTRGRYRSYYIFCAEAWVPCTEGRPTYSAP